MTKKDDLIWRLKEPPTADEVARLVGQSIITEKQAFGLLFREGNINTNELKDIKKEVELLRALVLELSNKEPTTIFPIVERYRDRYPWYQPYQVWCSSTASTNADITLTGTSLDSTSATLTVQDTNIVE